MACKRSAVRSRLSPPDSIKNNYNKFFSPHRLGPRTSPFHGEYRGSNPLGDASKFNYLNKHYVRVNQKVRFPSVSLNCYTWSVALPSQIHIFNRNGTYYFRRRIPKDFLSLYLSSQIIFSLKTKDRREADRLARIESVKLDQEFQHQRSTLPDYSLEEISDEDIEKLCKLFIAYALEEDEEIRMEGLSDRDYRKIKETLDIVDAGERHDFAKGDTKLIEFEMEDFCESHGFKIIKGSPTYKN